MDSEYQALYRKWRPMTFDDIIGQKQVSDTLKNGIASGRIAHAYLFCGTRGTGKTSTAKIFSRAVNCENPKNGEPCNECRTCRGILDGSIMDVYEMDAASNRGVENIRDIRDEIIYTPADCTYKVYIIDEVHMLTTEAFNALLKTLEEPPKHSLFILATTEPHKIPPTVMSRCQRFDFHRIGVDDIAKRLSLISEKEEIAADNDAIELIAELGDGSMRDALSLLDRCSAFGGEKLTAADVTSIVGAADPKLLFEVATSVAEGNTQKTLELCDSFLCGGKEPQYFLEELIQHFRCILLCKTTDNPNNILEKTAEKAEKLKIQSENFSVEMILYCIQTLSEALANSKWMNDPKLAAEIAVVKMCSPSYSTKPEALLARIDKLERMINSFSDGAPITAVKVQKNDKINSESDMPPWNTKGNKSHAGKAANISDLDNNQQSDDNSAEKNVDEWRDWADALSEIKKESKSLFAFLCTGRAFCKGDVILLELDSRFAYDRIAKPEGLAYLSKLFSRIGGQKLKVKAYVKGALADTDDNGVNIMDLAKKKDEMGDNFNIYK